MARAGSAPCVWQSQVLGSKKARACSPAFSYHPSLLSCGVGSLLASWPRAPALGSRRPRGRAVTVLPTAPGLEPEIQKLIAKHRQDIQKLKMLHEAELLRSDERAAQRYGRQAEELRGLLEREKEEQSQRERELARQRCVLSLRGLAVVWGSHSGTHVRLRCWYFQRSVPTRSSPFSPHQLWGGRSR